MSNDRARQLAQILQAIEDAEREMADYRADYKARIEKLNKEAWQLRQWILGGAEPLPFEPPTGEAA